MKASRWIQLGTVGSLLPLLAGLVGCAVGPDYHPVAALGTNAVPAQFGDPAITNEWKPAAPAAPQTRGNWWTAYGDAELNQLETLAATNNQQLAVAVANYNQARAAVIVAQSAFFPLVSADPSFNRQHTSGNISLGSNNGNNAGRTYNTFNAPLQASWELDLWGKLRREAESVRAQLAASEDELAAERLSIEAEVAADYFNLRSLDEQSRLLNDTAQADAKTLELTQNRHRSGIADQLDVDEAETQFKAAQAQIPAVDLQRAQMRHALAVLCGQPVGAFALTPGAAVSTNLPAIPAAVPSEWLQRRPDVAAAERNMAAANASVGVAVGAFYPSVSLNGMAGFESISASTWFDWPSHLWAVGPTLTLPLFTGGQLRAQLASAKAAYAGTVANYRQTVLTAFQDVEDQLAARTLVDQQWQRETEALAAAQRTLNQSLAQYKAGVLQYLSVITAQTTMLNYSLAEVQLRGQRQVNSVNLIRALGGTPP